VLIARQRGRVSTHSTTLPGTFHNRSRIDSLDANRRCLAILPQLRPLRPLSSSLAPVQNCHSFDIASVRRKHQRLPSNPFSKMPRPAPIACVCNFVCRGISDQG